QTTFNVNGKVSRGSAGLTDMGALPQNTTVAAIGSLGSLGGTKPVFNATEVYAGIAIENAAAYRGVGTVASRSGNTLHLHNTEVVLPPGSPFAPPGASNIVVEFANDVTVMVSDSTLLSTDRQPELQTNLQSISIGQQVDLEGGYALDSSGNITMDAT